MRTASGDKLLIGALLLASGAFAFAVWTTRPAAIPVSKDLTPVVPASQNASSAVVPRGVVLKPLTLPPGVTGVDLGAMPDRLANEAAPAAWQRVVTVRGIPGVASVCGPAVVAWTEAGIAYWLASPTRSTDELLKIADDLR